MIFFFLNGLDIGETSFSYLNLKKCDFKGLKTAVYLLKKKEFTKCDFKEGALEETIYIKAAPYFWVERNCLKHFNKKRQHINHCISSP